MAYKGHKVLAVIPAKGTSDRIPKKNLVDLAGKPLIWWTINEALRSEYIDSIAVSTDCNDISKYARNLGVPVYRRPRNLAKPNIHAIEPTLYTISSVNRFTFDGENKIKYDISLMLLPTSPLRRAVDIDLAVYNLVNLEADSVISVVKHKPKISIKRVQDGYLLPLDEYSDNNKNQQSSDAEPTYVVNGAIFASWTHKLLETRTFYQKKVAPLYMHKLNSIEIDTKEDLIIAARTLGDVA